MRICAIDAWICRSAVMVDIGGMRHVPVNYGTECAHVARMQMKQWQADKENEERDNDCTARHPTHRLAMYSTGTARSSETNAGKPLVGAEYSGQTGSAQVSLANRYVGPFPMATGFPS